MTELKIKLSSVDDVKKFVNTAVLYNGDFNIISGRYVIDGKSIMGMFSLDLRNTLCLQIFGCDKQADEIAESFKAFTAAASEE